MGITVFNTEDKSSEGQSRVSFGAPLESGVAVWNIGEECHCLKGNSHLHLIPLRQTRPSQLQAY